MVEKRQNLNQTLSKEFSQAKFIVSFYDFTILIILLMTYQIHKI